MLDRTELTVIKKGATYMRLSRVIIKNFRRIGYADIMLAPASFLIGQNNYGKSSVIKAIAVLLGEAPSLDDFRKDETGSPIPEMEITGYFSGIDPETAAARGFRGRVVNGEFCYIKKINLQNVSKPAIECLEYPYEIKEEFRDAQSGQDLVERGIDPELAKKAVAGGDLTKRLKKGWERELLDDVVQFDMSQPPRFVSNPGGFPSIVQSRLPELLYVDALTEEDDVDKADKNTLVSKVLTILFQDVLEGSELAATISQDLKRLEEEMSPELDGSVINKLQSALNEIISGVFPGCGIDIRPSLAQGLSSVLKPKYDIKLFSNVQTGAAFQGTGLLRTAVFAMLRYHAHLRVEHGGIRPLLVAFEEPELYLHPSAANLLRDTIYELGQTDQIICTTHSPWMIDLSKDKQSLTKMVRRDDGSVTAINYGVSQELLNLDMVDRERVKMLQVFDDEMSRVFFTDRVVVVEGDSELIAIKQTLKLLPEDVRRSILASTQVVKARGKASILSLVKYLHALSIQPVVIHDRDRGTEGSEKLNPLISDAVGDAARLIVLEECLEDVLGYKAPSTDKPFKVFNQTSNWKDLGDVPRTWMLAFQKAFGVNL